MGPQGPQGPAGLGFTLDPDGHYLLRNPGKEFFFEGASFHFSRPDGSGLHIRADGSTRMGNPDGAFGVNEDGSFSLFSHPNIDPLTFEYDTSTGSTRGDLTLTHSQEINVDSKSFHVRTPDGELHMDSLGARLTNADGSGVYVTDTGETLIGTPLGGMLQVDADGELAEGEVQWDGIGGIPAGFADNVDNTGGEPANGSITKAMLASDVGVFTKLANGDFAFDNPGKETLFTGNSFHFQRPDGTRLDLGDGGTFLGVTTGPSGQARGVWTDSNGTHIGDNNGNLVTVKPDGTLGSPRVGVFEREPDGDLRIENPGKEFILAGNSFHAVRPDGTRIDMGNEGTFIGKAPQGQNATGVWVQNDEVLVGTAGSQVRVRTDGTLVGPKIGVFTRQPNGDLKLVNAAGELILEGNSFHVNVPNAADATVNGKAIQAEIETGCPGGSAIESIDPSGSRTCTDSINRALDVQCDESPCVSPAELDADDTCTEGDPIELLPSGSFGCGEDQTGAGGSGPATDLNCSSNPCVGLNEIQNTACEPFGVLWTDLFSGGYECSRVSSINIDPGYALWNRESDTGRLTAGRVRLGPTGTSIYTENSGEVGFAGAGSKLYLDPNNHQFKIDQARSATPALLVQKTSNDSVASAVFVGTAQGAAIRAVGNIDKTGSNNFRIPHPLDPSKVLYHASIEAPVPLNVYSGNVRTDRRGFAVVKLPRYFDAINRDFRYQLTVVGRSFAKAIVWKEITGNRFTIRTDEPRVKVSWEVTAQRDDKYMREHPFEAERPKH